MNRTYNTLITLPTFEERLSYLRTTSIVAATTFGGQRRVNQRFYKSSQWQAMRNSIILRDDGKDLGLVPITGSVYVHHIEPIKPNDWELALDPNNLICVSFPTHQQIHYGKVLFAMPARYSGDTVPWEVK